MKNFELFDKVRIKSKNVIGFIVDIHENGKLDIEKEGNQGPVYWYIDESDIEKIEQFRVDFIILRNKAVGYFTVSGIFIPKN